MNHQTKTMIVDAIMKVVDSAPTKAQYAYQQYATEYVNQPGNLYRSNVTYQTGVSKASFDVWMNYIASVLNLVAQHIGSSQQLAVLNHVQNIALQTDIDYNQKTTAICQVLLEFARRILYL